jgi:hypothetical protein
LVGGLERSQATDFFENSLGIELVFQALEGAIYGLTFANDYFWHDSSPNLEKCLKIHRRPASLRGLEAGVNFCE